MVAGVELADDERDEGQTSPTRLFLRSRQVNGFGRRRSDWEGASGACVGAAVDVERRILLLVQWKELLN